MNDLELTFRAGIYSDLILRVKKFLIDSGNMPSFRPEANYVEVESNSDEGGYYIVTTVDKVALACTCQGFHFRKTCSHISGYNGSRT